MTWFDNIYDLQYYKTPKDVPCYCEELVYPNDMQLQGNIYNGNGSYTIHFYVYSADGLTSYEDATAYFDYYFAKMPDGTHFFNARLKSYSPEMCAHKCFLIRAVVSQGGSTLFDKYTERYCQSSCCNVASGISYGQDALIGIAGGDIGEVTDVPVPAAQQQPTSDCGDPLIRIISTYDCMDEFNSVFYGIPDSSNVLSGTASFSYTKVTSCKGRIVRRPREIKREVSYNCKLQLVESQPQYLLEAFEYFPDWKMLEIEGQLHAKHIWIDDYHTYKEYQFNGGKAFKQVHKCFELFKLEAEVQDCVQRQIFGCETCSDKGASYFIVPEAYAGGAFFSESRQMIAEDYDGLLQWLRSQNGVSNVEDVDTDGFDCNVYAVAKVEGAAPGSIYYDSPIAMNRSFVWVSDSTDNICAVIGVSQCKKPVNDVAIIGSMVCNTPANDAVIVESIIAMPVAISSYGDWTIDTGETEASVYINEVSLSIKSTNTSIIADAGEEYTFANEIIGTIGAAGRPETFAILDHANNVGIPADTYVLIDHTGAIRFTGTLTIATANEAVIELDNLKYTV
jgi:hypothetical protein